MKRQTVLAWLAGLTVAPKALGIAATARPSAEAILHITGNVPVINNNAAASFDFTEAAFLALPQVAVTTSTPWTPRSVFVGPLLATVMRAAGVNDATLTVRSLDETAVSIPWRDLVRFGVILAHSQNGKRFDNKRWGPLWTIYPRDQYPSALGGPIAESRFIWQVNRIEVRS